MGEFIDDLEIGKWISENLGFAENKSEGHEESLGYSRLGSSDLFSSLGLTILFFTVIFMIILLIAGLIVWFCRKKAQESQKNHRRMT